MGEPIIMMKKLFFPMFMLLFFSSQTLAMIYTDALLHLRNNFSKQATPERDVEIKKIMGLDINFEEKLMEEYEVFKTYRRKIWEYINRFGEGDAGDKILDEYMRRPGSTGNKTSAELFHFFLKLYDDETLKNIEKTKEDKVRFSKIIDDFKIKYMNSAYAPFYDVKLENVPKLMMDILGQNKAFYLVEHSEERNKIADRYGKERFDDQGDALSSYMAYVSIVFGSMCAQARDDDRFDYVDAWFEAIKKPEEVSKDSFEEHCELIKGFVKIGMILYDSVYRAPRPIALPNVMAMESVYSFLQDHPELFSDDPILEDCLELLDYMHSAKDKEVFTDRYEVIERGGVYQFYPRREITIFTRKGLFDSIHFFSLFYSGKNDEFNSYLDGAKPEGMSFKEYISSDSESLLDFLGSDYSISADSDEEEEAEAEGFYSNTSENKQLGQNLQNLEPSYDQEDSTDDFAGQQSEPDLDEGEDSVTSDALANPKNNLADQLTNQKNKLRKRQNTSRSGSTTMKTQTFGKAKPKGDKSKSELKTGPAALLQAIRSGNITLKKVSNAIKKDKKLNATEQILIDSFISKAMYIEPMETKEESSDEWELDAKIRQEEDEAEFNKYRLEGEKLRKDNLEKDKEEKQKLDEIRGRSKEPQGKKSQKKKSQAEILKEQKEASEMVNTLKSALKRIRKAVVDDEIEQLADYDWDD